LRGINRKAAACRFHAGSAGALSDIGACHGGGFSSSCNDKENDKENAVPDAGRNRRCAGVKRAIKSHKDRKRRVGE
jgi:hypothetical protein